MLQVINTKDGKHQIQIPDWNVGRNTQHTTPGVYTEVAHTLAQMVNAGEVILSVPRFTEEYFTMARYRHEVSAQDRFNMDVQRDWKVVRVITHGSDKVATDADQPPIRWTVQVLAGKQVEGSDGLYAAMGTLELKPRFNNF